MNDNSKQLEGAIFGIIYNSDEQWTMDSLRQKAGEVRESLKLLMPVTDEEFESIFSHIREQIPVEIGKAHTLRLKDPEHKSWYLLYNKDRFYWDRYREFLLKRKNWNRNVVAQLDETTDSILDDLGNPNERKKVFNRRGLLLGDVQSGKTATYTAICNKAADAGYRVIIVLAGLTESLREQTQERLDAEFVGRRSQYELAVKAVNTKNSKQEIKQRNIFGVGKIGKFPIEKKITCFTSVVTDFSKKVLQSNDLTLQNLKGTALFVVKKNKSVLTNLHKWLIENNADQDEQKIDLPLLLIDDEADNASVNTQKPENDPTAINKAIRSILDSFYQSSYLGVTATPFANIFIDSDDTSKEMEDLFPRDFITVLPIPSNYIGAKEIFGYGEEVGSEIRNNAKYNSALVPILNDEMTRYFYFKHKEFIADSLNSLPDSLKCAIYYFIIACAIRDMRGDRNEHCSMLVNVSRFNKVQNKVAKLISEFVREIKSEIEVFGLLTPDEIGNKAPHLLALKDVWDAFELQRRTKHTWQYVVKSELSTVIKRIETYAVNQTKEATKLDYFKYRDVGLRVIAVGGNTLSRGLTLEGLCVSYFYRNSQMYDTLLQMGRWFGYRPGYDDLFKIWMAEDAIDWYGFVSDATLELKEELLQMERENKTPEEFGLRVRQDPNSLIVTARNKMRTGTIVHVPLTLSGRLIETPRLIYNKSTLQNNADVCHSLFQSLETAGYKVAENKNPAALIWKNIPREHVIKLIKTFVVHPWNLNYQSTAISKFIEESDALSMWDIAIPIIQSSQYSLPLCTGSNKLIKPITRNIAYDAGIDEANCNKAMLRISGRHVRIGSLGCTKIGLSAEEIARINDEFTTSHTERGSKTDTIPDTAYLTHATNRNPLLLIYIIQPIDANKKPIQIPHTPKYLYALGLGFPGKRDDEKTVTYVVNQQDLRNWIDLPEDEYDDDI